VIYEQIHEALAQVRRVQNAVLEKRSFKGYSGQARIVAGTLALAGAAVMQTTFPSDPMMHVFGWGGVCVLAMSLNYLTLFRWYLKQNPESRHPRLLKPVVDAVPAVLLGGVFSLVLIRSGQHDLLFGFWMCMYGLAHAASRQSLPTNNYKVGLYYIACGLLFFCWSPGSFLTPWPMGLVFFVGEWVGGLVLWVDAAKDRFV